MMKTNSRGIIALLLACIMAVAAFCSCKLTPGTEEEPQVTVEPGTDVGTEPPAETESPYGTIDNTGNEIDGNTVVMRSANNEINLYDFGQSFYNGRNIQYYMYGMMTPQQYCESVVQEVSTLLYLLEAAHDKGVELTEEELADADKIIDEHLEQLLQRYEEDVEEGAEDKRAEAIKLLEADLNEDGIDYESFLVLSKRNVRMFHLADKLYQTLDDDIAVTEEEVLDYVARNMSAAKSQSVSDFVQAVSTFNEGNGAYPVAIPDDCFSVNHIYLGFKTNTDDDGNAVTDTESRREDEAKLEALITEAADYDAFMELETQYGEDPGMDNEMFREYGYIIHPDLAADYFPGFVYAAMNLHEGTWIPKYDLQSGEDVDYGVRDIDFFELKDGTKVVKVYTDSGVHYIIVNREYSKGEVQYEKGDVFWNSWEDSLKNDKLSELYSQLSDEWQAKYHIDVDMDTILSKYGKAMGE